MRRIVVAFVVLLLVVGTFTVLDLRASATSASPDAAPESSSPHKGILVLNRHVGSTAVVITASWQRFTSSSTVRVNDRTADIGVLCLGQSSHEGNGSCSWSIQSTEAQILGDHTIEATDGVISAIAQLTMARAVVGLGTSALIVLVAVLASITAYRLRRGLDHS